MVQLELDDFERAEYNKRVSDLEYVVERLEDIISDKDKEIETHLERIARLESALDTIVYDAKEALR